MILISIDSLYKGLIEHIVDDLENHCYFQIGKLLSKIGKIGKKRIF